MTVSTYRRFVAELIEKRTEQAHEPGFQVMDFEWDEEKRLTNIEKHGIDFIDADILFGNPHLVAPGAAGHPHDLDAECKKWRKKKASGGLRKLN